jgi:hypothetical protein
MQSASVKGSPISLVSNYGTCGVEAAAERLNDLAYGKVVPDPHNFRVRGDFSPVRKFKLVKSVGFG